MIVASTRTTAPTIPLKVGSTAVAGAWIVEGNKAKSAPETYPGRFINLRNPAMMVCPLNLS